MHMRRTVLGDRPPAAGRWLLMALVAALGLAGCSGTTSTESTGPADTIASASQSDGDGDASDDDENDGDEESPAGPSSSLDAGEDEDDAPGDDDAAGEGASDDDAADASDANDDDGDASDDGDDPARPTTTTPPEPENVLTAVGPDDSGDDVVALQNRLDELGFSPGPADGDYGRRTETAVAVFQQLADLMPTGEAGIATMRALASYEYDGLLLAAGDEGDDVEELQRRLADGPFDPGTIDGVYGKGTVAAVWALEKLAQVPIDGDWGPADELAWRQLMDGEIGGPERDNEQRWVEVDLSQQLMKVYDPGNPIPVLISHASSGSGIPWENEEHSGSSVTPRGDFHINRRISGWRESSLNIGRLYNPLYFNGGIAFHGATSVPLYPASHGCIRLPMHIAEYLPEELPNGTPVHVLA